MQSNYDNDAKFIRGNLRQLFTDHAAVPFSWFGQRGNIAVNEFECISILTGNLYFGRFTFIQPSFS